MSALWRCPSCKAIRRKSGRLEAHTGFAVAGGFEKVRCLSCAAELDYGALVAGGYDVGDPKTARMVAAATGLLLVLAAALFVAVFRWMGGFSRWLTAGLTAYAAAVACVAPLMFAAERLLRRPGDPSAWGPRPDVDVDALS